MDADLATRNTPPCSWLPLPISDQTSDGPSSRPRLSGRNWQGSCRSVADKYIECEFVLIAIDLALHRIQAYRHLLFNRKPYSTHTFWVSAARLPAQPPRPDTSSVGETVPAARRYVRPGGGASSSSPPPPRAGDVPVGAVRLLARDPMDRGHTRLGSISSSLQGFVELPNVNTRDGQPTPVPDIHLSSVDQSSGLARGGLSSERRGSAFGGGTDRAVSP